MNVIIVTRKGIMDTPILVKSNSEADSVYENIARELLGDDFDDVIGGFIGDFAYEDLNRYLEGMGVSVDYFTDVKTN